MKNMLIIICVLFIRQAFAQTLVPYRIANKFSLSDEQGKIIVTPAYDDIAYLKRNYFQYINTRTDTDSVHVLPWETNSTGLFCGSRLIIKEQLFKYFLLYDHCIIGSQNPYHPEHCTLYNLKGERLINEPVQGMSVNESGDFGSLVTLSKKFTLLIISREAREEAGHTI